MNVGKRPYVTRKSLIHGKGVFATRDIRRYEHIIAPWAVYVPGTFHGFNHSCDPNVSRHRKWTLVDYVIVLKNIKKGEELTVKYDPPMQPCNCQLCRKSK